MGVPNESRLNEAILDLTTTRRARNVARDLPLHRLLALQERAIGMISVDTGPAHSAGALGCPLVVLFGIGMKVALASHHCSVTSHFFLAGNFRAGRKFRDRLDC